MGRAHRAMESKLQGRWSMAGDRGRVVRLRSTPETIGWLPTQIATLAGLRLLSVQDSVWISGTVPTELGTMRLARFGVTNCTRLSGTLPTELGGLYKSFELLVRDVPLLSGSLPTQLSRLQSQSRCAPCMSIEACSPRCAPGMLLTSVIVRLSTASLTPSCVWATRRLRVTWASTRC
jgi:ribosomal protein L30/L7E